MYRRLCFNLSGYVGPVIDTNCVKRQHKCVINKKGIKCFITIILQMYILIPYLLS